MKRRTACCGLSLCRVLLQKLADLEERLGGLHGAGIGHRGAEGKAAGLRACEGAQAQTSECGQHDSSRRSRIRSKVVGRRKGGVAGGSRRLWPAAHRNLVLSLKSAYCHAS